MIARKCAEQHLVTGIAGAGQENDGHANTSKHRQRTNSGYRGDRSLDVSLFASPMQKRRCLSERGLHVPSSPARKKASVHHSENLDDSCTDQAGSPLSELDTPTSPSSMGVSDLDINSPKAPQSIDTSKPRPWKNPGRPEFLSTSAGTGVGQKGLVSHQPDAPNICGSNRCRLPGNSLYDSPAALQEFTPEMPFHQRSRDRAREYATGSLYTYGRTSPKEAHSAMLQIPGTGKFISPVPAPAI